MMQLCHMLQQLPHCCTIPVMHDKWSKTWAVTVWLHHYRRIPLNVMRSAVANLSTYYCIEWLQVPAMKHTHMQKSPCTQVASSFAVVKQKIAPDKRMLCWCLKRHTSEDTLCFVHHKKDIEATERLRGTRTSCLSVQPLCKDLSSQTPRSPETCNPWGIKIVIKRCKNLHVIMRVAMTSVASILRCVNTTMMWKQQI